MRWVSGPLVNVPCSVGRRVGSVRAADVETAKRDAKGLRWLTARVRKNAQVPIGPVCAQRMRPTRSEQDASRPPREDHARVKRELEEADGEANGCRKPSSIATLRGMEPPKVSL